VAGHFAAVLTLQTLSMFTLSGFLLCILLTESVRIKLTENHGVISAAGRISIWFLSDIHETSNNRYVGFEVLTAVVMKSSIFWDITSRGLLKVRRRFGGIFIIHIQGRRISQVIIQSEAGSKQSPLRYIPEHRSFHSLCRFSSDTKIRLITQVSEVLYNISL
jgi:hypothetical protein